MNVLGVRQPATTGTCSRTSQSEWAGYNHNFVLIIFKLVAEVHYPTTTRRFIPTTTMTAPLASHDDEDYGTSSKKEVKRLEASNSAKSTSNKPTDKQESYSTNKWAKGACPSRQTLCQAMLLFFVIGMLLILLGVTALHSTGYICGSLPPSTQEIEARGAPVCLTTSVRDGALCLQTGLDPNEPSVWCQQNMANVRGSRSFYLWWSPCERCGTAWRMFRKQDNDSSDYKALQSEIPKPYEAPLNATWTEYIDLEWFSTDIEINECLLDDVNKDGIPNVCFAEKQNPIIWIIGTVLVALAAIIGNVILCALGQATYRRGDTQSSYFYGSGCKFMLYVLKFGRIWMSLISSLLQ